MERNKKFLLIGILVLIIAGLAAVGAGTVSYLPAIQSNKNFPDHTRDPCIYYPYPLPTENACITQTPVPNPYPVPDTPTPRPTQTPWIITATPLPKDNVIYLPISKIEY